MFVDRARVQQMRDDMYTLQESMPKVGKKALSDNFAPLLLTLTFVEDGLRVITSWSDQMDYMRHFMHMSWWFGALCLVVSALTQLSCSAVILSGKSPSLVRNACYGLLAFIVTQPVLYGQLTNTDFVCRSITLAGGLLMFLWSVNDRQQRGQYLGMLQGGAADARADKLQLSGRMLMAILFFFQSLFSEHGGLHAVIRNPSAFAVISSLLLLGLSLLVCIGYKTVQSAAALAAVLTIWNMLMHPFWSEKGWEADLHRYYFFQTLSIIGGLVLLAVHGPGGLSIDSKKAA